MNLRRNPWAPGRTSHISEVTEHSLAPHGFLGVAVSLAEHLSVSELCGADEVVGMASRARWSVFVHRQRHWN